MSNNDSYKASDTLPPGPFLGRRLQLARLCHALEEARLGAGGRLWIVGPQGIGKSRLLAEIAGYAAWRHFPVEHAAMDLDPQAPQIGSGLLIVDPVAMARVATLNDRLCRVGERGILALATATSADRCVQAGIPEAALVAVGGLDPADSLRLLGAWLGSVLDPAWARLVVRSTFGHPGRMREVAERFLATDRVGRSRAQAPSPAGF